MILVLAASFLFVLGGLEHDTGDFGDVAVSFGAFGFVVDDVSELGVGAVGHIGFGFLLVSADVIGGHGW